MRVVVIAGPAPGHVFPAIALCRRFGAAGADPVLFTGDRWLPTAREAGLSARPLPGLALRVGEPDTDAGARIHARAAHMATRLLPELSATLPELVVSDVLTAGGGMAAQHLGVPWVELSPHPLYLPSKGLPPIGSGLSPGVGVSGRLRDTLLRAATARSLRHGRRQRAAARRSIGLPEHDPGPAARLIATLPALEVDRPDWPDHAHVVGPLLWEPTDAVLPLPPGDAPLVVIAPSTAEIGAPAMVETTLTAVSGLDVRVAVSMMGTPPPLPDNAVAGMARQDLLLAEAAVVVAGGGHGLLAKSMLAGKPTVLVPGGGDQWELANRAARYGNAVLVSAPTPSALRAAILRTLHEPGFTAAAVRAGATAAATTDPVEVCRTALARTGYATT